MQSLTGMSSSVGASSIMINQITINRVGNGYIIVGDYNNQRIGNDIDEALNQARQLLLLKNDN